VNAFADFYTRQKRTFLSYLVRRSGDYHLACDVMQESFARLFQKYRPENFTPQLLYTIGRNLVLDSMRRRNRDAKLAETQIEAADSVERDLMVRDEYRRVLAAMRRLDPDERDLLSLAVSGGLRYREMALIAETSEANVKVKIHRARKKLRDLLAAEET
jgi:RNA polymerase sigma-70 factor (ECF subfamily)